MTLAGQQFFFCGVGGSGMLPLAVILRAKGAEVAGSDRSFDQGVAADKAAYLRGLGITLFPQNGSGVTAPGQTVVASAAVEPTVPDIAAAIAVGARRLTRPELLAQLFNAAPTSIGVAGTSGKSTTTAMLAFILHEAGRDPTVMNGAVMKNFADVGRPFASALVGAGDIFVSEIDESDGSIALYEPSIGLVNNIAVDHKSMEELQTLFGGFVDRAGRAVLNLDNAGTRVAAERVGAKATTYSLHDQHADFVAGAIVPAQDGVAFDIRHRDVGARVTLSTPGAHNVSNALAAIAAAVAAGVPVEVAADALARFAGVRRRLERVGVADGVLVIDDFAHNPDKIGATLRTLHEFPGRILAFFQPHGFGPLRLMRREFAEAFAEGLGAEDALYLTPPAYFGGTVDRSVTSADLAGDVAALGRRAAVFVDRERAAGAILSDARPGDRIVVMGARDDTLSTFAASLVARLRDR